LHSERDGGRDADALAQRAAAAVEVMTEAGWRAPAPGVSRQPVGGGAACEVRPVPGILVVGSVPGLRRLEQVGRVQRARWDTVRPRALRVPAELVVVGTSARRVHAAAVIARLKDDPATAAIPVLHAGEGACPGGCGADFCLSTGPSPGQLARVAEALLELARARARRSGLVAATFSVAGAQAAPPAA
jgi:hypothetical protein